MTLDLRVPAKVLLHVWSYDFNDTTLSTELQRRHIIISFMSTLPEIRKVINNN